MMIMFPIMEAVRSGGDLENIGGSGKYSKEIVCLDGCVIFKLTAKKLGMRISIKENFSINFILPDIKILQPKIQENMPTF